MKAPPGFDTERIVKRLNALEEIYKKLPNGFQESYLNDALLRNCVESYFLDIERTKHFHEIKLADEFKKAAYTIKWIARIKPIQLYEGAPVTRPLLMVNEVFALFAGISFLVPVPVIKTELVGQLLYALKYRPLDGETFSLMMVLLKSSAIK